MIQIVRPRIGGLAAASLAGIALRAMLGFGAVLLAPRLAIRPWGTTAALVIAACVSAVWSGALLLLRARPRWSKVVQRGI